MSRVVTWASIRYARPIRLDVDCVRGVDLRSSTALSTSLSAFSAPLQSSDRRSTLLTKGAHSAPTQWHLDASNVRCEDYLVGWH